jgi:hypothetical protein
MKIRLKREYLECGFGGGKTPKRKWKNVSESEWMDFYKKGITEPFEVVHTSTHKEEESPLEAIKKTKGDKNDINTQGSN